MTVKRNFSMGATNIQKGTYERFNNKNIHSKEDELNMLLSSSAIPGLFPFVDWRGTQYIDGGFLKNFDPIAGIQHCID